MFWLPSFREKVAPLFPSFYPESSQSDHQKYTSMEGGARRVTRDYETLSLIMQSCSVRQDRCVWSLQLAWISITSKVQFLDLLSASGLASVEDRKIAIVQLSQNYEGRRSW